MYRLMVSHDCGTHYSLLAQAEDPSEFDTQCDELDVQGLRWAIEDESGEPVYRTCAIHRGLLALLARWRAEEDNES